MARVNIFDLVDSFGKESITHPEVKSVTVKEDGPKNVKEDTPQEEATDNVKAAVTDTKITEPGPKDGGGDGKATTADVKNVKTGLTAADMNVKEDQNGGRHMDTVPNDVKAKDGLSNSDVRTSVEEHDDEVADIETIETGGVAEIGEANDLVMDIDAEAEESEVATIMTQSESDLAVGGKILSDIGELETAKASVERYLHILNRMESNGVEMSNELRQVMAIGLESISADLFKTEVVTLENHRVSNEANDLVATNGRRPEGRGDFVEDDDDTEFDGARDKTKKGLSGKLKQIWEAIKRAFQRSANALIDLYQSFMTDTTKVAAHLKDLAKRVRALEGGQEIKLRNSVRLMIGNEFVGNSPEAIKRVTKVSDQLLIDWPNKLSEIVKAVSKGTGFFKNVDLNGIISTFEDAIDTAMPGLKSLNSGDKGKVPSGLLNVDSISWSDVLPGNRALYVGIKRGNDKDGGTVGDMVNFGKVVNIKFSVVPGGDVVRDDETMVTPDSGEALQVIKALEELIATINSRKEGMTALKELVSSTRSAAGDDMWASGLAEPAIIAFLAVNGVASETTSSQHLYIGYLISMIKAYVGYIEGSIKIEQGSGNTYDA